VAGTPSSDAPKSAVPTSGVDPPLPDPQDTAVVTPPMEPPAGIAPVTMPNDPGAVTPPSSRARAWHLALVPILALSAVLNTHRLAQNGYANTFYSAGVKSMLVSWHNFFFAAFDPGGLVSIDKPPLAMWLQAASAELFGLSPMSLLLPEAIVSTLAVAVLYRILFRRLGIAAALAGAVALAVFPSFVAVSRDNGVDPLLILLMILACGAALNAIEDGRWRWLIACAVLIALAFNTKTLAAYLVIPGIALAYMLCAPGTWLRRARMLLVAGLVMGIGSFLWIAAVELTPASQRPYVGSSTNNTELGLTFEYNGFGRVEGEVGGPGQVPVAEGAMVRAPAPTHRHYLRPPTRAQRARLVALERREAARRARLIKQQTSTYLPDGRLRNPIVFGGAASPLRLFEAKLADQGAWMLPFALIGLIAFALLMFARQPDRALQSAPFGGRSQGCTRTDADAAKDTRSRAQARTQANGAASRKSRLALLLVFGGWLLVEVAILDFSNGIVHPYYISAAGPGAAAMIAAGCVAFAWFAKRRAWRALLLVGAVAATVAVQVSILDYQHYMRWFVPVLIVGALVGLLATTIRRLAAAAIGFLLCLLLVAPAWYAKTTWLAPVQGTFAAAGPHQATGDGGYGINAVDLRFDRNMIRYVATHRPGTRWSVLTVAAPTAAPMILLGSPAGALAGYSGTDPALDGPALARLVSSGQARYVALGGAYASRGGNLASKAVLRDCRQVPYRAWHGPVPSRYELVLFDCTGRERALSGRARSS
jgi:4-amino-4-deoxy-L-arabinose transferase-like glycosyltransferase